MSQLDPDLQAKLDERARTMAEFTPDYRPFNQYVIYRADLEMPPEKLAAQCAHGFQLAMEIAEARDPTVRARYKGSGNGTKIIMSAKNQGQMIRAYRELTELGIPCELVIDRGHVLLPHFDGQPLYTALGFGPVFKDEVAHITKRYTQKRYPPMR